VRGAPRNMRGTVMQFTVHLPDPRRTVSVLRFYNK
jgi:hypothetical protein